MNLTDFETQLCEALPENSQRTVELCLQIVRSLLELPDEEGQFLTYTSLQKLAHVEAIDSQLVSAVAFLTSSRLAVLHPRGQYVDDDGNEYTLDDAEFQELIVNGTVVHPETGEVVENAKEFVVPFFEKNIPEELQVN